MTNSQNDRIAEYLTEGHSLTAIQALKMFSCFRLASRISDLKKKGMDIVSKPVKRNGKIFSKYFLDKPK